MAWTRIALDHVFLRGNPTPDLSGLTFAQRHLADDEVDELTKSRALKPMVNTNHMNMKFEITCQSAEIHMAKDILLGFVGRETQHWYEYYEKIAQKAQA